MPGGLGRVVIASQGRPTPIISAEQGRVHTGPLVREQLAFAFAGPAQTPKKAETKKSTTVEQKAPAQKAAALIDVVPIAFLIMERGGNLDVAISLAQTAVRGMPNNPSMADTLGWGYYRKGIYGSARDVLESASKAAPENATIHFHLGLTYDKMSEPAKASEHLKRALQLAPNGQNATEIRQVLSSRK